MPKPICYVQGSFRHSGGSATFASSESCSSWLPLILLSQSPVLIPEDFSTQVVEPSTAPQRSPPLARCMLLQCHMLCPCTTPVSCQPHPLQSPAMHRAPSLWHADSTSPLLISPASSHLPLFWPFDKHAHHGPSAVSAPLQKSSSLTTLTHLKPCPLFLCTVTMKLLSKPLLWSC